MARKGYKTCPECGVEVKAAKLNRHIRNVHPKKAKKHGLKKAKGSRKAKVLSPKKIEMLAQRRSKELQKKAVVGAVITIIIIALVVLAYYWSAIFPPKAKEVIVIETSMGTIEIELYEDKMPISTENFKKYVKADFYDGVIFHRVTNLDAANPDSHIIQTGGFNPGLVRKDPLYAPIALEADPELKHEDGSVAMARTNDPNSATSQFYICDGPQPHLDDNYAVFGKVIKGQSVVKRIANVAVGSEGGMENVPREDVIVEKVYIK